MEISYWQSRWDKGKTGWHMQTVYPPLPKLWEHLNISGESCVLVPLCGKSIDLQWFTQNTRKVVGVDASPKALQSVMQEHPEPFTSDRSHGFSIYRSESLELWEGDFIKLPPNKIPPPDLIYDKAAIIALPPEMRSEYTQKIIELSRPHTHMLIQTFEYEQDEMTGPPFSVDADELQKHYGKHFLLEVVHEQSKLEEFQRFQQRGLRSYLTEKIFYAKPLQKA